MEWVLGKTAGAIGFVSEAQALLDQDLVSAQYIAALTAEIEALKSGSKAMPDYEDPEAWLRAQERKGRPEATTKPEIKSGRPEGFCSDGAASARWNGSWKL
jgi:hypothetical protein